MIPIKQKVPCLLASLDVTKNNIYEHNTREKEERPNHHKSLFISGKTGGKHKYTGKFQLKLLHAR